MLGLRKTRKKEREKMSASLRENPLFYYFTSEDKYLRQFHLLAYAVLLDIVRASNYHSQRNLGVKHFAGNLVNSRSLNTHHKSAKASVTLTLPQRKQAWREPGPFRA